MRKSILAIGWVAAVAVLLIGAGCKRQQQQKKYKGPFEGTAVEINRDTNEVSMKLVAPEQGLTITRKGYVSEKTQVQINGMTARLEDVQPGDPVNVTGYFDENKRFVVTSISVRRSDNGWVKAGEGPAAASSPATRPAGGE